MRPPLPLSGVLAVISNLMTIVVGQTILVAISVYSVCSAVRLVSLSVMQLGTRFPRANF